MDEEQSEKPTPPDLPAYLCEPLETQSPDRLVMIAAYARELAAWKRQQRGQARGKDTIGPEEKAALEDRDHSTDPGDYAGVPKRVYITIKTTKQTSDRSYDYYYWQWREGETWNNEYIAPVISRA